MPMSVRSQRGMRQAYKWMVRNTTPSRAHLTPNLNLRLLTPDCALWTSRPEHCPYPDPYWAFYWPGGQGLTKFMIENESEFKGRVVLDLGCGCGAGSLAAAQAGASTVLANDIDSGSQLFNGINDSQVLVTKPTYITDNKQSCSITHIIRAPIAVALLATQMNVRLNLSVRQAQRIHYVHSNLIGSDLLTTYPLHPIENSTLRTLKEPDILEARRYRASSDAVTNATKLTILQDLDVIVVGDLLYESGLSEQLLAWLRGVQQEKEHVQVYLGDPGRHVLSQLQPTQCSGVQSHGLQCVAHYALPTNVISEHYSFPSTNVYQLQAPYNSTTTVL